MSMNSTTQAAPPPGTESPAKGSRSETVGRPEVDWQSHPSVNIADPCPYCGARALHAQHCKRMCLACGWLRSCVD